MVRLIEVNELEDIDELLDSIHDRFYQPSKIDHDSGGCCLNIPITVVDETPVLKKRGFLKSKWSFNVYKAILIVNDVINYSVNDDAEIDEADINTIEYENNVIVIKGSIPVSLTIKVSSLCMRLEVSDEPFQKEERATYRFLGLESSN